MAVFNKVAQSIGGRFSIVEVYFWLTGTSQDPHIILFMVTIHLTKDQDLRMNYKR